MIKRTEIIIYLKFTLSKISSQLKTTKLNKEIVIDITPFQKVRHNLEDDPTYEQL